MTSDRVFGAIEVVLAAVIAIGVALLLSAWIPARAAAGSGLVVGGVVVMVIVIAAQIPPKTGGG